MAITETFLTTDSWTCPAGVTSVDVECWGAGGSGGRQTNNTASGGGGGAYSKKTITVTPTTEYTVTVGEGGALKTSDGNGNAGGDSWFSTDATVLAKGGSGGDGSGGASSALGGQASSGVGDTKYSGGNSGSASGTAGNSGGGSSAGTGADGNNSANIVDGVGDVSGATAPTGGGNGGRGALSTPSSAVAGSVPGGGGGGAVGNYGDSGAGANGKVLVTYDSPELTSTVSDSLAGITDTITTQYDLPVTVTDTLAITDDQKTGYGWSAETKPTTVWTNEQKI